MTVVIRPLIIGHRGNPGNPLNSLYVENTAQSFYSALTMLDADGIEFDIHLSSDGILFIHHDDYPGRVFTLPDNKKPIAEYTIDELRKAQLNRAGLLEHSETYFPARFSDLLVGDRIPLLDDVLSLQKGKKVYIELKFLDDKKPSEEKYLKELAKAAADFVTSHGLINNAVIISFVPESLYEVKKINPNIITGLDVFQNESYRKDKIQGLQSTYGIDQFLPPLKQTLIRTVDYCKDLGLSIFPWTWDENCESELSEIERVVRAGVNGVITNQPQRALELITRLSA